MANSWVKKAVATAAIATGLAVAAPAAANAGIYTWHYEATYTSNDACVAAGKAAVSSQDADAYRCTGTGGVDLYLGYIW
jgi:hypothetical protein